MANRVNTPGCIKVGDYFESCNFHPCLCFEVDETGRNIEGISLVDGHIQNCSVVHCGIRQLSLEEAISWKMSGPKEIENMEIEKWW
jgi:hypothetical protein